MKRLEHHSYSKFLPRMSAVEFDTESMADRDLHRALQAIGTFPWMQLIREDGRPGGCWCSYRRDIIDSVASRLQPPHGRTLKQLLINPMSASAAIFTWAVATFLGGGPKIFRPTIEQCESLRNVDLRITLADYRQSFPAIVVVFPAEFRAENWPPHLLVAHDPSQNLLGAFYGSVSRGFVESAIATTPEEELESMLAKDNNDGHYEFEFDDARRVALNSMLLLTQYETRIRADNPERVQELKRNASRSSHKPAIARRRRESEERLIGEPEVIEFTQHVCVREEQGGDRAGGNSHIEVSPHWRRGHWRRQAHGLGRELRKLIFIRPVLVREDLFAGPLHQTSASYELPSTPSRNVGSDEPLLPDAQRNCCAPV